ncbi:MAG: TlpA family protein disulfide reductase [bacterium]|nr:TlpA family protein disulfide reductase [bacterium]
MRVLAVAALALLVGSGAAAVAAPSDAATADLLDLPVRRGDAAPVPLRDVVGDGRAVVTFWASYCAPCRAEVPTLDVAARRWAARDVRIIGVAVDLGDAAEVARVAADWGIHYDTYWIHPGAQERAQRIMPEGLPTSFAIWKDRIVRHPKYLDPPGLEKLIVEHLGVAAPE